MPAAPLRVAVNQTSGNMAFLSFGEPQPSRRSLVNSRERFKPRVGVLTEHKDVTLNSSEDCEQRRELMLFRELGRNRNDPQRATGSADNFQRRRNDNSSGRRKLVKIAQAGQTKLPTAVHQVVVGERWIEGGGLAGIGSDCLYPDAQDVALFGKECGGFFRESGGMWTILFCVDVILRIRLLRPVCAQQDPRSRWNASVLLLPLANMIRSQQGSPDFSPLLH